ncbi:MAG: energy-coupled thiamine transporter ThiT [Clostridia bacterium]
MDQKSIRRLVECALLIAIGTVLSLFDFKGPWALGGGITVCSMLPLVMIAHRHGTKWGVISALLYSLLQLLLGLSNVQYAPNALVAVGIIALDYVLAFTVIGFSACFNHVIKDRRWSIVAGIAVTLSWAPALWSFVYNGSYMLPEIIITALAAFVSYAPLKRFWTGEDLAK